MGWWQDLWEKWRRPAPPVVPPPAPLPDDVAELLREHNRERQARGLPPLVLEPRLGAAARKHASWMYRTGRLSHTGEGGSHFSQRVRVEGYEMAAGGENIAAGYTTVMAVVGGWMNSPGHRANILGRAYTQVGFGRSGNYWCAVLAHPAAAQSTMDVSDGREFALWLPGPLEAPEPPPMG